MEEILDLDELQEEVVDENLKEFMSKDEEAEKLLNEKIEELAKEEEKLSKKEEEVKSLEESNRDKISSNASADELIDIANKLKEAESELADIQENIDKLSKEKEEIIETKNSIEESKKEYIKNLNTTNSTYEEQIKKISEAIEVCDNPTLKQVLEDVNSKRSEELSGLEKKRRDELKSVLKEEQEEKPTIEVEVSATPVVEKPTVEVQAEPVVETPIVEPAPVVETPVVEKPTIEVETPVTPVVEMPTVEVQTAPVIETPIVEEPAVEVQPIYTEEQPDQSMINIDSILDTNNEVQAQPVESAIDVTDIPAAPVIEEPIMPTADNSLDIKIDDPNLNLATPIETPIIDEVPTSNLNAVVQDKIEVPEVNPIDVQNENKTRIIYEKEVPASAMKEIYSSSKIMPPLYDYLDNKGGMN